MRCWDCGGSECKGLTKEQLNFVEIFVRNEGDGAAQLESIELDGEPITYKSQGDPFVWYEQRPWHIGPGEMGQVILRVRGLPSEMGDAVMAISRTTRLSMPARARFVNQREALPVFGSRRGMASSSTAMSTNMPMKAVSRSGATPIVFKLSMGPVYRPRIYL